MATKKAIQAYIFDHYSDLSDLFDNIECIAIRSIEKRLADIRTKLGIPSRMDSIKKSHTPVRAGETDLDSCGCDTEATKGESETVPEGAEQDNKDLITRYHGNRPTPPML